MAVSGRFEEHCATKTYGEVEVQLHALTSVLDRDRWAASRFGRLTASKGGDSRPGRSVKQEKLSPAPETELWFLRSGRSLVITDTELSRLC
jgi:hypothetical protein